MMRRHLAVFIVVLFLISTAQTVQSNANGKTGHSSSGCTCHSQTSATMSLSLSGLPSSGYSGSTTYSLSWDGGPHISGTGGFNIIVTTTNGQGIMGTWSNLGTNVKQVGS